ncbi:pre-B-cell leukemia transcription factor-interacting protein 1 isoform X3 [Pangasianodon hypophthalmus]|uniref:pre-B-cell leukemia transcription factor-interacting protein 1 isoform X3 n=1 Tax=Pangasianodon hypophthalmus TaxID=310915 RepID=UPI002307044E|nr:pre-B-cell leukemia transcription factor-interacting protein 1 isoform X3 [Pangasianodon hypophthalmus]XP_053087256.1 pre-B-cell leukemia transcription factor-interacting protein 1 isoform X3 [Pangasianodon hypophthalmus]XP_053087257.1 pre-B-cell leukemia transcription factor-interacting protein 1 isoform X3 [Pangasianodon hypophthalmus]
MSDNSTGSSGSSSNSWTLLSPEVCQETSPELFDEGAVSGPSVEDDPEICAPVIHATITTSPPDNDLLGAVPFSLATESSLFLSQGPFLETSYEESLSDVLPTFDFSPKQCPVPEVVAEATPEFVDKIGPASEPTAEVGPASEPTAEVGPASEPTAEVGPASEPTAEIGPASEPKAEISPASECTAEITPSPEPLESSFSEVTADVCLVSDISHTSAIPVLDIHTGVSSHPESSSPSLSSEVNFSYAAESPYPETPASLVLEEKELVTDTEEHKSIYVARDAESLGTDVPIEHQREDSGLRQRRVHYPEELRQSSDEEDGEETEFKLQDRKEEKPGLSMSHLIVGALALLCLGSFFFSGTIFDQAGDDFDGSELSDKELLEKLVEENKQISILEAQIQAQKEELDRALRATAEKGITDKEHARMKEELSALPSLKEELETLKTRVSELTQLTGEEPSEPSPGFSGEGQSPAGPDRRWGKKDELKRQKILLEQSKTRLEGMKKQDWPKKWLRERLVEMQQRLSEQVDRIGKKDEWRKKHKGGENRKNEWGDSVQRHKELLKKYSDEWEHKKAERKLERERRKQERSWQAKQKHDHKLHQHHESKDFWKHQEKKLRRNQNPPEHCHDVSDCAEAEGLVRVKLSDFRGLLDIYLNKLQGLSAENKEAFHHLVAKFFHGGIFSHDRMLFSEFAEDVADILEDLADVLMDDDVLEEEMEEFEREVLWQFAA